MDTNQLQAFLAVAGRRQLTSAARQLGVSQPTLSRQVQALEKELGVRLLVRTPRGVVLTDAGERFLAHAREGLEALRAGATELHELANQPRGPVALGTLPTVGAYLMPALLQAFLKRYPDVHLRLEEGLADELEEKVADGDLDLAIVNLPFRRADLVVQKLWEEKFALVAPRGHKLTQSKRPVSLAAVAREPLVVVTGTVATLALRAAAEAQGIAPRIAMEVDHPESLRRMVERGLGVALLPELMSRDRQGANFDVAEVRDAPRRTVALVHRGERSLTSAARALKRVIAERLQRRP
ncbi:MAG: LysR family transcriptional regulator [Deltaproteobacteria bacterium]|nr:LysR family transcriptional regulator [Deltaproteobacteria bacterium]